MNQVSSDITRFFAGHCPMSCANIQACTYKHHHNEALFIFTIFVSTSIYDHFHNILRLFDVLPNFPFTTSETMGDHYLQTWYVRLASRVAERLKT